MCAAASKAQAILAEKLSNVEREIAQAVYNLETTTKKVEAMKVRIFTLEEANTKMEKQQCSEKHKAEETT